MYPLQEYCRITVIFHVLRIWWDFSMCYLMTGFTVEMKGPMFKFPQEIHMG